PPPTPRSHTSLAISTPNSHHINSALISEWPAPEPTGDTGSANLVPNRPESSSSQFDDDIAIHSDSQKHTRMDISQQELTFPSHALPWDFSDWDCSESLAIEFLETPSHP
ncbi:hypothetical protein COCVIDRAFT_91935, partial [Bipolaris victoriae FI3]